MYISYKFYSTKGKIWVVQTINEVYKMQEFANNDIIYPIIDQYVLKGL